MKILLVNQCFYPDVVATAQYTAELASALVARGHEVTVIASNRGYDDPSVRFAPTENWKGVRIRRVHCLATGKGSRLRRALNIGSFFLTCAWRMVLAGRCELTIALTSPPLISALAALFVRLTGGRFIFWIMDLNPDEAIAAGWLKAGSRTARLLEAVLLYSAQAADRVIVLDRFMQERMSAKGLPPEKLVTLPPWSHDTEIRYDHAGRDSFRARHGLEGKYVVMYSGNHSPCHPLDTILEAAREIAPDSDIVFCFVGGGSEYRKVLDFRARHSLPNIVCLPYQPLSELSGSLSSADLHLVVMGPLMAGLVHPCKIYNVLALGIPVLYVGPQASHVADIAAANPGIPISRIANGDVADVVAAVRSRISDRDLPPSAHMRQVAGVFSAERLIPLYAGVIETIEQPDAHMDWSPVEIEIPVSAEDSSVMS
jgi:colanic acid biosynthesis glycosyl transferase WcaI